MTLTFEDIVNDAIRRSGQSEAERTQDEILAILDTLGGKTVGEDSLTFKGTQFILPENMAGNIKAAMKYLRDWDEQQNTEFDFSRSFPYKPFDGAAAFERAMRRLFGTTGVGRATVSFFGRTPPRYRSVAAGPGGQTIQVPWGDVEFSPLEASFSLYAEDDGDGGPVFALSVTAPRRHRRRVEAFFKVVEDELQQRSLYKGRAITNAGTDEPQFVNTGTLDPDKMIYTSQVMAQLDANLWAPLKYTETLRDNGIPLKRAVLLEGPNGTGKSLAGLRTAQIAQENGWTYILVHPGEDALAALQTARMYAPAVVWVEDLDVIASKTRSRASLSKVLDALDSAQVKGSEVMAGFTTNFADTLDKGVIRAGRLDAVIHVAGLDRDGYERLIRSLIPPQLLAADIDFGKVIGAYADEDGEVFLPAFAAEAAQRAVRYNVARNGGNATQITTEDLVDAALGMRDHLRLMKDAEHGSDARTPLEDAVAATVASAMRRDVAGKITPNDNHSQLDMEFSRKEN